MKRFDLVWAEDVSHRPDLVEIAVRICAEQYVDVYGDSDVQPEDLRTMFGAHGEVYGKRYLHTMIAFGADESDHAAVILGTVTYRIGSVYDGDGYPLSFMNLVQPECGWDRFDIDGFDPSRTVEATLTAFTRDVRRPEDLALRIEVFRVLHTCGLLLGRQYDCDRYWALLARPFAKFIGANCRLPCKETVPMLLNEEHRTVFDIFPRYWRKRPPGVFITGPPRESFVSPFDGAIVGRSL